MAAPAAGAALAKLGKALAAGAASRRRSGGGGPGAGTGLMILLASLVGFVLVLVLLIPILFAAACNSESGGGQPDPSDAAKDELPAEVLQAAQAAGQKFNIDWTIVAAVQRQECPSLDCKGDNGFGCASVMQISYIRGSACSQGPGPTLWEIYGADGDGDGRISTASVADGIFTGARVLRQAKQAPATGGSAADYRAAVGRYHGACVGYYVSPPVYYCDEVMARAAKFGFRGGKAPPARAVPITAGQGRSVDPKAARKAARGAPAVSYAVASPDGSLAASFDAEQRTAVPAHALVPLAAYTLFKRDTYAQPRAKKLIDQLRDGQGLAEVLGAIGSRRLERAARKLEIRSLSLPPTARLRAGATIRRDDNGGPAIGGSQVTIADLARLQTVPYAALKKRANNELIPFVNIRGRAADLWLDVVEGASPILGEGAFAAAADLIHSGAQAQTRGRIVQAAGLDLGPSYAGLAITSKANDKGVRKIGRVVRAMRLQPSVPASGPIEGCPDEAAAALDGPLGVPGKAELAAGADRAGVPTKQVVIDFVAQMAGVFGRKIIITTGTNHSQFTSSGNVSDHWTGYAADLGSALNKFADGSPGGTRLAASAHRVCGASPRQAIERASRPNYTSWPCRGWAVQILWLVEEHFDHVHIGLQRVGPFSRDNAFAGDLDQTGNGKQRRAQDKPSKAKARSRKR